MLVSGVSLSLVALWVNSARADNSNAVMALRQDLSQRVRFSRHFIRKSRPEVERSRLDDIRVRVLVSSDETKVRAYLESGFEQIDITLGFRVAMEHLIDAWLSLPPKLAMEYAVYYADIARQNEKLKLGDVPTVVKAPLEWAGRSKEEIAAHIKSIKTPQRDILLTGVVTFVLAHEMAHHVLDHSKKPAVSFADSQDREIAADKWASDTMIGGQTAPFLGCFAFLYFAALDLDALKHEEERYHPADIRRLHSLIDNTIVAFEKISFDTTTFSRDEFKTKLEQIRSEFETVIKDKTPLTSIE